MVTPSPALQEQLGKYRTEEQLAELSLKKSEVKTLDLLFRHRGERSGLFRPELTGRYSGAGKALYGSAEAGLVTLEEQRTYRDPFGNISLFFAQPETLTPEQDTVLSELETAVQEQEFSCFLLQGFFDFTPPA